jgi:hypothetical protein
MEGRTRHGSGGKEVKEQLEEAKAVVGVTLDT